MPMFLLVPFGMLIYVLVERTALARRRFAVVAVAGIAFISAMILGGEIRKQLFLHSLPDFDRMTMQLIQQHPNDRFGAEELPEGWNYLVADYASVRRGENGSVAVLYLTRDSTAVGHSGFMYYSGVDPKVIFPNDRETGFKRIAPNWYLWGD